MRERVGRIPRELLIRGYAAALLALLTLALANLAYEAMFNSVELIDDDGYVLISLREFTDGGAPYDQVYSLFGPGFFVLVGGGLDLLGALTTDGSRMATLVLWLGATFLTGLTLHKLTRSLIVAATGLLVSFLLLSVSTNEPLHPGSTIAFLLIAMVAAAVFLLPGKPRAALATLGGLGAALLAIKVNVGLLALAAICFAVLITAPQLRHRRLPRIAGCALLTAVPFLLVSDNLDQVWAARYASVVSLGALAFLLVALRLPPATVPGSRHLTSLLAGAGMVITVLIVVPLIGGTSVSGLVEGVILNPLGVDDLFTIPLRLGPLAPLWGAAAVGAAVIAGRQLGRDRPPGKHGRAAFGALRLAAGLVIWIFVAGPSDPPPTAEAVAVGASLAWVAAIPPREIRPETSLLRALIPGLALLQLLHGYPVAGSQLGSGLLLLVVAGGICIGDGIEELSRLETRLAPDPRAWRGLALLPVVAFALWFVLTPLRQFNRDQSDLYEAGVPLDLPGAERVRLGPERVGQLQDLVAGIREHCRSFLTIPGMNSLYLWTEQGPPTGMNGTDWMWFFDTAQQQAIVDQVRGMDGLCVVRNDALIDFWEGGHGAVPDRPLVRFINRNFKVAFRYPITILSYDVALDIRRRAGPGRDSRRQ